MRTRVRKRILSLLSVFIITIMLTACGGAGKTYKWGDASFTVKGISDDPSVVGEQDANASVKRVGVTIDFGKDEILQRDFEGKVVNGMFLLDGKKPTSYDYHLSNMTWGGEGFEAKITGKTVIFFDMDQDYKINESDLVIKE